MNRNQRNQNRATARDLAEEVLEMNLPHGLSLRGGKLTYECSGCRTDREWCGTPEEFADPDSIKACGGTQWCIP